MKHVLALAVFMLILGLAVSSVQGYSTMYIYGIAGGDYYAILSHDTYSNLLNISIYQSSSFVRSRVFTGVVGVFGGVFVNNMFVVGVYARPLDRVVPRLIIYGVDGSHTTIDFGGGLFYVISPRTGDYPIHVILAHSYGAGTNVTGYNCNTAACVKMYSYALDQKYVLKYTSSYGVYMDGYLGYAVMIDALDLKPRLYIFADMGFSSMVIDNNLLAVDVVSYTVHAVNPSNINVYMIVKYGGGYYIRRYACGYGGCSMSFDISMVTLYEDYALMASNVNGNGVSTVFRYGSSLMVLKYDNAGNVVTSVAVPLAKPLYIYDSSVTRLVVAVSGAIVGDAYSSDYIVVNQIGQVGAGATVTVTIAAGTVTTTVAQTTVTVPSTVTVTSPVTSVVTTTVLSPTVLTSPITVYRTVTSPVTSVVTTTVAPTATVTRTIGVETPITVPMTTTVVKTVTYVTTSTIGWTTITSPWRAVMPIVTTVTSSYVTTTTTTVYPLGGEIANIAIIAVVLAITAAAIFMYMKRE